MSATTAIQLLAKERTPLAIAEREGDITRLHYHDPEQTVAVLIERFDVASRLQSPTADVEIVYLARPDRGDCGWLAVA